MAKVHYIIDSRKKAQIEKRNGKTTITIEDTVRVEENHIVKLDYGKLINFNDNKSKKVKCEDVITIILYLIAIILLVIMFALLGISKDFNILTDSYIDNLIGIAALLFAISSIPKVKEFLSKILTASRLWKKLWYIIMMLCLPFYIIAIMNKLGFPCSISNTCGIIGIIICIITW